MAAEKDMTWIWLVVAAVVVVGFFIFHQSIAPVTTAPIKLVPAGSQAAVNTSTVNTQTNIPGGTGTAGTVALANAATDVGIANAIGSTLTGIFGGDSTDDDDDTGN